ncbi:MAG: efflux RND transporter permease subunit [Leptospiraceae bacterium]|nr:efflux RND transporter permease subunit [Leptospiraceae bacterium]
MLARTAAWFLQRPMLVSVTILFVFGLGILNASRSRKEGFPEISMNKIIIRTVFPGASARDVEFNVTIPIEEALEGVEGIQEIISQSQEGLSLITIEADNDASPAQFQRLYNDVDQAVAEIKDLPADLDGKPMLSDFTSNDIPVLEVALHGDFQVLKPALDKLEKELSRLPDVAYVDSIGAPDLEAHILVDAQRASRFDLGLPQIARAIQARNLEGSGGTLESFTTEKKIVFLSRFEKYEEILDTVLRANIGGYATRLRDVAVVRLIPKDVRLIVRNNGRPGAVLSIKKTAASDIIKVVDQVQGKLQEFAWPAGVEYRILQDQSSFTRNRLQLLFSNAAMGFVLVCLILYIVFDLRTAVWTAFGIPFSLLGLVSVMYILNISINLISLGGFIIIIGMLVDDAIVIAEEVISNREAGQSAYDAALTAVRNMGMPVFGAVITSMIAFSPLFSIGGFPGKFIWAIPLMVICGLLFSVFESFYILPSHLAHMKAPPGKSQKKAFIQQLESGYEKALRFVLHHMRWCVSIMLVLLLASIVAMNLLIKKDPFPQDASEGFSIRLTSPPGTPSSQMIQNVKIVETALDQLPQNELLGYSTRVGTHSEASNMDIGTQANLAMIFVYLHPWSDRKRRAAEIMDTLQEQLQPSLTRIHSSMETFLQRIGPPMGKAVEIRVISNNDAERNKLVNALATWLKTVPGVHSITDDRLAGKTELNLIVDYQQLALTGLQVADVLSALRIAFDGQLVSSITTLEGSLDFRLRLDQKDRADPAFLRHLPLTNPQGQLIRLGSFSHVTSLESPAAFNHVHGLRAVTVSANIDLQQNSPVAVAELARREFPDNEAVELDFAGQARETSSIFADLGVAALAALAGIFLVISLLLNSFRQALVIMLPLPMLLVGVVGTLLTHGLPMSMLAGLALVGLLGVVVNDSIVMVHKIEAAIQQQYNEQIMISAAVSRLRPVLLTTVTTVAGVLPTGYGIGGYDPFLSQMCLVMAWGLLFASLLTLFVVPMVYHTANLWQHKKTNRKTKSALDQNA